MGAVFLLVSFASFACVSTNVSYNKKNTTKKKKQLADVFITLSSPGAYNLINFFCPPPLYNTVLPRLHYDKFASRVNFNAFNLKLSLNSKTRTLTVDLFRSLATMPELHTFDLSTRLNSTIHCIDQFIEGYHNVVHHVPSTLLVSNRKWTS